MTNWNQKLAAWLHDPAEKVLNLLRDREGHEFGTVKRLRQELGIRFDSFDPRADHLAAAADRPQWPRKENGGRYQAFEQVNFARQPELVHPLTGDRLELPPLSDTDPEAIKARSLDHFSQLIQANDPRLSFLAFWRFGPEAALQGELGQLWSMQLADSRVPDHSIWNHLDVVSAIHTSLDEGDEPALLAMSFGPVQGFISQARTTSDLWAGSHLLSSLVWEAMKTVVSDLGPDAVLFPALRGVPAVDKWLLEQGGEPFRALFSELNSPLLKLADDRNPLFAASLPNKFVAIVPAKRAKALAEAAIAAVQQQAHHWAEQAARKVFDEAGESFNDTVAAQIREQLNGFPEAHWAAVTWPVASHKDGDKVEQAATTLRKALAEIHPQLETSGIFEPQIWKVLSRELTFDGVTFWAPNTGILYPAVYELAERSLAASKASRTFAPLKQEGYRCSLSGDVEWLTHDRSLLGQGREQRKLHSVWGKLKKPAWAKKGEHLGAVATLKRLWPTLFAEQVGKVVGADIRRYVISTHALAFSTAIENLVCQGIDDQKLQELKAFVENKANGDSVTLPASLIRTIYKHAPEEAMPLLKRLPSAFENSDVDADGQYRHQAEIRKLFNGVKPEAYYALILMDGDRMGAWLAGNEAEYGLAYGESWHSKVKAEVAKLAASHPSLGDYMNAKRPPSPARHVAISRALNDFSTYLARHVVEDCCKGKLIYAGGDDVLALVAVDDLFTAMELLRLAYSGIAPHAENPLTANHIAKLEQGSGNKKLLLKNGFGRLDNRLMTLMGRKATASMGVVVAHHSAPLSMVLRELRSAEGQAKNAGRDRFCLRVLKRGGGEVGVTAPWWGKADLQQGQPAESALRLMSEFAHQLAATDFSRGAIYNAQLWFAGLTDNSADSPDPLLWREQVASSLARQFERQQGAAELAKRVVDYVCDVICPKHPLSALESLMVTAEFFAREARGIALKGAAERKQRHGNKEQQPL